MSKLLLTSAIQQVGVNDNSLPLVDAVFAAPAAVARVSFRRLNKYIWAMSSYNDAATPGTTSAVFKIIDINNNITLNSSTVSYTRGSTSTTVNRGPIWISNIGNTTDALIFKKTSTNQLTILKSDNTNTTLSITGWAGSWSNCYANYLGSYGGYYYFSLCGNRFYPAHAIVKVNTAYTTAAVVGSIYYAKGTSGFGHYANSTILNVDGTEVTFLYLTNHSGTSNTIFGTVIKIDLSTDTITYPYASTAVITSAVTTWWDRMYNTHINSDVNRAIITKLMTTSSIVRLHLFKWDPDLSALTILDTYDSPYGSISLYNIDQGDYSDYYDTTACVATFMDAGVVYVGRLEFDNTGISSIVQNTAFLNSGGSVISGAVPSSPDRLGYVTYTGLFTGICGYKTGNLTDLL